MILTVWSMSSSLRPNCIHCWDGSIIAGFSGLTAVTKLAAESAPLGPEVAPGGRMPIAGPAGIDIGSMLAPAAISLLSLRI